VQFFTWFLTTLDKNEKGQHPLPLAREKNAESLLVHPKAKGKEDRGQQRWRLDFYEKEVRKTFGKKEGLFFRLKKTIFKV